jgi:hypothetical protein
MALNPESLGSAFGRNRGFSDSTVKQFVDSGAQNNVGFGYQIGEVPLNKIEDPTYLGFSFVFDRMSPLFNLSDGATDNTAYSYLLHTYPDGNQLRAKYMKAFVESFLAINDRFPYYFQSIEGLDAIWKKTSMFNDPYFGGDDAKISVECLEALDLKITGIMDLYRKAVYDPINRRVILPENLREFDVVVYIKEIRKFRTSSKRLSDLLVTTNPLANTFNNVELDQIPPTEFNSTAQFVNENTSYVSFTLKFCEFVPEDSSVFLDNVSNVGGESAKQKISWLWKDVEENNRYSSLVYFASSLAANGLGANSGGNGSKWANAAREFAKSVIYQGIGATTQKLVSTINQAQLGNVFGFSLNQLQTLLVSQSIDSVIRSATTPEEDIQELGRLKVFSQTLERDPLDEFNLFGDTGGEPPPYTGEKILPDGNQPTNKDGNRVSSLNAVGNPLDSNQNPITPLKPDNNFAGFNQNPSGPLTPSNNFAGSNIPAQSFEGENVLSSNQNPSTPLKEKILGAAQTPTNLDGSTPPKLKREQILGGGGPSGPSLTPENIF